jgi:hypothetical protein
MLIGRFQKSADLKDRVNDADDADEDDHIGREKIHDKLENVIKAIGGNQAVNPKEKKDDRKNGDDDVLKPP